MLHRLRNWWWGKKFCGRLSSTAILRGRQNIRFEVGVRLARHVELNASTGSIFLAERVSVGPYTILETRGGTINVGAGTTIGPFCVLYGHGGLFIGKNCLIASHVVCIPENHRYELTDVLIREQGWSRRGIHIGDDVWLATGVVVVDGVSIGTGAVIGAGAVVTRDIPPQSVAVGVPARVIGKRGKLE